MDAKFALALKLDRQCADLYSQRTVVGENSKRSPPSRPEQRAASGVLLPPNAKNAMIGVWVAVALGRRHPICSRQHRQESLCRHR